MKTLCSLLIALLSAAPALSQAPSEAERAVSTVLDALHDAASKADGARYFDLFTDDAVFLGTDATERWTVDAFKAYATPYFDQGRGWTYTMTSRNIFLSEDGQTAWFDERLDNENFGTCRGTGVLVRRGEDWKIAQYNLTIPIPNALAYQVVDLIRKAGQEE